MGRVNEEEGGGNGREDRKDRLSSRNADRTHASVQNGKTMRTGDMREPGSKRR